MLDMLAVPVKEVGGAMLRRVGTAFSAFLVAQGIPTELTAQLLVAVGAVLGVGFDIVLALFYRRKLRAAVNLAVKLAPPAPVISDLVARCPLLSCETRNACQLPEKCLSGTTNTGGQ